jgi:hypothetical protein
METTFETEGDLIDFFADMVEKIGPLMFQNMLIGQLYAQHYEERVYTERLVTEDTDW